MKTILRTIPLVLAVLAAGCEGLTTPPQPIVSVLRRDGGCFALMTNNTPIAPILDVAGTCSYTAEPALTAGVDLVEVVVDYGPDVDFAGNAHAPPPILTLSVDGVVVDDPIDLSPEQRVEGRAYFIATFRAPSTPSPDVRLTVGVNPGFQITVPTVFTTLAPLVQMSLLECPDLPCELTGAVGSAHIKLVVVGTIPQVIAVHAALDGVPQPDPVPPRTTQPSGDNATEDTTALAVPAAHDGAGWLISAQLGTAAPTTVGATIRPPQITTRLSCSPSCNLAPGDPVGLDVSAPALIRPLQALVDTRLDGFPLVISAPVTLVQHADGTAGGTIGLTAPATPGNWQIDVSIAGYFAPAIVTAVN